MGKNVENIKIAKKKPAKKQSDCHCCFLKTTGNLILISPTEKILNINTKLFWEKCVKYKNSVKLAKKQPDRY